MLRRTQLAKWSGYCIRVVGPLSNMPELGWISQQRDQTWVWFFGHHFGEVADETNARLALTTALVNQGWTVVP